MVGITGCFDEALDCLKLCAAFLADATVLKTQINLGDFIVRIRYRFKHTHDRLNCARIEPCTFCEVARFVLAAFSEQLSNAVIA
jgi:hypothetical protein